MTDVLPKRRGAPRKLVVNLTHYPLNSMTDDFVKRKFHERFGSETQIEVTECKPRGSDPGKR